MDKFVSADLVGSWCKNIDDMYGTKITPLLFGLLGDDKDKNDIDELIHALTNFSNTVPKKVLGGKSPQEKRGEMKNWKPQLNISITPLGGDKWIKELEKAHYWMGKHNARKAIKHFEKTFLFLKTESAANPNVYRFYANAAVCYFQCFTTSSSETWK